MLEGLRRALKIPDLRRRILFTLGMFIVFRIGVHIPVPGMDREVIGQLFREGTLFNFLDIFSGGALKAFSVFAMSIGPYINASIIMQLLTVVIPALERLSKEGEEGRKKLVQYTRYATVVLALLQGYGMTVGLRAAVIDFNFWNVTLIALTLTAGTTVLMWIGELITDKGIGNGISLIIFAGIVSVLPSGGVRLVEYLRTGTVNPFNVLLLTVIAVLVIAAVVAIQQGERRITVQYAKRVVGRKMYGGQATHIPLKVNTAGVIPVIFAASLLAFPATIAQFFDHPWAQAVVRAFNFTGFWYVTTYALLIIFFTYFYTAIIFNPADVSENLKKYGGFIPGLRPGRPTTEYIDRVVYRITLAGAVFLAAIAIMPNLIIRVTQIPGLYFGGTALLIVVGVALETMKQIEAHLLMRQYQGFIR